MLKVTLLLILTVASAILVSPLVTVSGATWSPATAITNDAILRFSTSAAQDGKGTVYLFWDQSPGINYLTTNTSNIAKGVWPGSTLYTTNATHYDYTPTVVALKNGTLLMFYASQRAGNWAIYVARYNNGLWSPESRFTNSLVPDQNPTAMQDSAGKIWLAWARTESGDINIKFVDTNSTGAWGPGDAIVYDTNGNGVYDSGEPVIYGSTPALGTSLKNDPRIKFIDSSNTGMWHSGEFVVFDPNLSGVFDPTIGFVDRNNNNIWDPGEPVIYDADADGVYISHAGIGNCLGTSLTLDCMIAGNAPANQTLVKVDQSLKFVDTDGDGVWKPGDALVSDRNNNGVYATGDPAIIHLSNDPKLKFVGSGTAWAAGNSVVYDGNGNGVFDSKVKFVDSLHHGHWDSGDTVVYDDNLDQFYDLNDIPIFETTPGADLGKALSLDPGLKFLDSNHDGAWEPGEAVVYDSNLNGIYDGRIKFVDTNGNGIWVPGEAVVYDTNNDGKYDTGKYNNDTVIAGTAPANNTALKIDPRIKFHDKTGSGQYVSGYSVVYDADNDNVTSSSDPAIAGPTPPLGLGLTTGLGEPVIASGSPATGTALKTDSKVKYVESDGNNVWDPGEDVIYDANNTGTYNSADPVIFSNGTLPSPGVPLKTDPKLEYSDANNNNIWDSGEAVVYDADLNHVFDAGEYIVAGIIPESGSTLSTVGEPVISGPTPVALTSLKTDPKIRFGDTNANGHWNPGESVVYDSNNNTVFDNGDIILAGGSPVPASGTPLKAQDYTLAGITVSSNTILSYDPKVKFVGPGSAWAPGETVVYDSNNDGFYETGKLNNDTIIAGPIPANMTGLKSDSLIKYSETDGNTVWDNGESVVYDRTNDNKYDSGDSIIAVFQIPSVGSVLKSDSKIKYAETGTDKIWNFGESVVYDINNTGVYGVGMTTIAGPDPAPTTSLSTDSNIKFIDTDGNGIWDPGEAVVYSNGNTVYNLSEMPIASGPPEGGTPLKTVPHIFYNIYNGTSWLPGGEQRLTSQPSADHTPSLGQTEDGRIWITWSGDRGVSGEILYRTTRDGMTWTPESLLASSSLGDRTPSILQDRNGTIWVAWSRAVPCSCGGGVTFQYDLYYTYSVDIGATWIPPTPFMTTKGTNEIEPTLAQFNDEKLYVFYSAAVCGSTSCNSNLSYINSLINVHDARMNGLCVLLNGSCVQPTNSTDLANLRIGQTLRLQANVTNAGDFNDTFMVTIKANGTAVASANGTVLSGRTAQIIVSWVPGVPRAGYYTMTATVSVTGEGLANMLDNSAGLPAPGRVLIRPAGDVDGDCKVNIVDLVLVAQAFGAKAGSPGYNPAADLDGDGVINIVDLSIVGTSFGQTC